MSSKQTPEPIPALTEEGRGLFDRLLDQCGLDRGRLARKVFDLRRDKYGTLTGVRGVINDWHRGKRKLPGHLVLTIGQLLDVDLVALVGRGVFPLLRREVVAINEEEFGTTADYLHAFKAVRTEGIAEKHMALLRAHLVAPGYTTTWAGIAEAAGYPNSSSVNLQYGKFAERIARQLGLSHKPLDPNGTGWWLWVLVRWANERDPSGHTAFVLRRPVIEAVARLGIGPGAAIELLPDELDAAFPMREGARYQVLVNAYERSPEARQRCIEAHGTACCICGFSFGSVYGPEAEGYIHVHHLKPLSEVGGEGYVVDPVEDLRPVCPNCHAVLHLGGRCRSIDEVRQLLR